MLFRSWTEFKELFLAQYFPQIVQDEKLKEFLDLLQGNSTVTEYETRFTALSRFGKDFIDTGYKKCRRFEHGLAPSIRRHVVPLRHSDYGLLLEAALASEKEGIETGHIKDRSRQMRAGAIILAQQQHGTKRTRDDAGSSRGALHGRAPQSSATVPYQQGYG